jgi:hypothetical protein
MSGDLIYYQFDLWPRLKHGIFTRQGGVSQPPWASLNLGGSVGDEAEAVRHNHGLIYETLGLNGAQACSVWQVHGTETIVANQPLAGRHWIAQADSMITNRLDTPLVMRFADCTPLLFYDPTEGVIGLAHAGWRGTVQGMGASAVRAMTDTYGCKPRNVQAGIGPSIGPKSYQVGEEVVEAVERYFGATEGLIRRNPDDGTAYFDLWAANRRDLERAGVEQIEVAGLCTFERNDEFFSHRAEKGRTGRFGVVVSL